ncbi:MAG: hypothetical protein HFI34_08945 [Lachnospiraceae bacterium]|nr:hypothetical protein [Lachnospiraceae bacterium]
MNKNTKLILAVIVTILCISLISGSMVLMMERKEKWPPDDIYVFNTKGYMAYETEEEITIDILLCSLHRNGKNPMEKYENIYFETDTGIRYQSDITSNIKELLFDEGEIISQSIVSFPLNGTFVSGNTLNFTKMILQNEEGREMVREFGNIEIELLQSSDLSKQTVIEIPTAYSARLDKFEYTIENKTKNEITVQELYLGDDFNYKVAPVSVPELSAQEIRVDFLETEGFGDSPEYVILKPKFQMLADQGQEYVCSAIGRTAYSGAISNAVLREYLWKCVNGEKIH